MRNKLENPLSRNAVDWSLIGLDIPLKFESPTGIRATTYIKDLKDPAPRVNGKDWKFKGGIETQIHFLPDLRDEFDPTKRSDSLLRAVNGLDELVRYVDTLRFNAAPTLLGYTNVRMALMAQRMGFVIADKSKNDIARYGKMVDNVLILAKYEDVARKARELAKSDVRKKLAARVSRLELS